MGSDSRISQNQKVMLNSFGILFGDIFLLVRFLLLLNIIKRKWPQSIDFLASTVPGEYLCGGIDGLMKERDISQVVEHPHVKVWMIRLILRSGSICSFGYFLFQLVVHNWCINGCDMCCPVCGKVHIHDPLMLNRKGSLCDDSSPPLKKYLTMTICLMSNSQSYEYPCALEASLYKTNFPFDGIMKYFILFLLPLIPSFYI